MSRPSQTNSCASPHTSLADCSATTSAQQSIYAESKGRVTETVSVPESAFNMDCSRLATDSTGKIAPKNGSEQSPTASATSTSTSITKNVVPSTPMLTAAHRRRAKELATVLLSMATCQACLRPLQDPVSLPCGHSACLQCIKDRTMPTNGSNEEQTPTLPCTTHLPPRLPLTPMTVSCPVHGCPRSAIGRGIGIWAGHLPRYGLNTSFTERLPSPSLDVGPGSLPVDGFVVGVAEHPQQLTVIGPQLRSQAHLFASSVSDPEAGVGSENLSITSTGSIQPSPTTSNLLRTNVTLTKAVAILRRYGEHLSKSSRQRRDNTTSMQVSQQNHRRGRGRGRAMARLRGNLARARGAARTFESATSSQLSSVHPRAGPRTRSRLSASHSGLGHFGMNESDLESGTVGGVSAVLSDFDDENEDDYESEDNADPQDHAGRGLWTGAGTSDEGEEEDDHLWPDRVGGAFSRPLGSAFVSGQSAHRKQDKLKRRRSKPIDRSASSSLSPTSRSSYHTKVPKTQTLTLLDHSHLESGWSTEESAVDSSSAQPEAPSSIPDTVTGTSALYQDMADAKHSLSLSNKAGLRGEPLVQSVATLHSELVEVLECHLCYLLLYQPLTTPCGHTFCKPCFARSLDHGNKCPLCRAEMPNFSYFQNYAPNAALLNILTSDTATFSDEDQDSETTQAEFDGGTSLRKTQKSARTIDDPEKHPHHFGLKGLYEQRKSAIEQEEREARLSTPIFVCTLAFPGMPTILHIFEPRYRLMMRRCLESGNPRFGMVLPSRTNGGTEEYGTMLEIKSMQMLADGRSMIETVGSYRFKLLEKGSLDGYTVGRVERVDDISLEDEADLERAALCRREALDREKMKIAKSGTTEDDTTSTAGLDVDDHHRPDAPQGGIQPQTSTSAAAGDRLTVFRDAGETTQIVTGRESTTSQTENSAQEEDSLAPFPPVPAEPSTQELIEICTAFIETLRSGSAPWLLSRLNHTYGPMPSADEVERLGYWMALVMPIDEHEKAKLLPITSRRLRLRLVVSWIEQLRQSWWFNSGCTVS